MIGIFIVVIAENGFRKRKLFIITKDRYYVPFASAWSEQKQDAIKERKKWKVKLC